MKTADIEVTFIDRMGTDLSVVNAARVSFDKESDWEYGEVRGCECFAHGPDECVCGAWDEPVATKLSERDKKLIQYLATHEHTSPFNHCFASFRVKAPIFVARQLVKHKFLPWNEVSRRYVDGEPEFYIENNWRKRSEKVKQGSSEETISCGETAYSPHITELCLNHYNRLLIVGVCPEQARMVLPQNTMTEWIWSGSLGAFANMCRLRLDSHSQQETRLVAEEVAKHLRVLFPVSFPALVDSTS